MHLETRYFRADDQGPRLLVTGGVHGDEFEPILAIRRLIRLFTGDDPLVTGSVTFVPVVNENAFFRGHRCAEDGLDLARTCPGRKDGSITEQTAAALSDLIRSSSHYIDLHTGGTEFSVHPLAGYSLVADPAVLETQRRMARAFNLPVIWGTSANLEGRSLSVARDAGVPAIYCEYLGSATVSDAGIEAYFEGVLNVMTELGMVHRTRPENRVEEVVEDMRPGSGHMQVCHPAPMDGCFEPAVALGDRIEKGRPLGHVLDFGGEVSLPVPADADGRVIGLRTFPRVKKGEMTGVIMSTAPA